MIHRSGRGDHLHDVFAAAVGTHGQATADHFAHGREVGCDAEVGLGTAVADAEAGHHFIEHQQSTVLLGDFAQTFQKTRLRCDEAGIADDRLKDHAGNGLRVLRKQLLDRFQVVVRGGEGVGCGAARHPRGVGKAQGGHT